MIHKTAIVDSKAKISSDVEIGPYCIIGPNVEIGEKTIIQSHVNISVSAKIGKGNKIYPFVSINDPQDLKYNGEPTNLVIGDNNKIREYVTINPGTLGGGGKTVIGNNCLLMAYVHIGHDCILGDNIVLANMTTLGGHVSIDNNTSLGGGVLVHQFCKSHKKLVWDNKSKIDQLTYINGLTYERNFYNFEKNKGFKLMIGKKDGKKSRVVWRLNSLNEKTQLKNDHFIKILPSNNYLDIETLSLIHI